MKLELMPGYKHLVQKPYCCAPCCFSMILIRRNLAWIDQEIIAKNLEGFAIAKSARSSFVENIPSNPRKDAGIDIKDLAHGLNRFAKKNRLPLEIEMYFISEVADAKGFIIKNLTENNDIIANMRMDGILRKAYGHYCLISKIRIIRGGKVLLTLCDPYSENKSFYDVNFDILVRSMSKKPDGKERGFIIVKSNNREL